MKRLALLLLLLPLQCYGQAGNPLPIPVTQTASGLRAGATITVCNSPATGGVPCTNYASIFSDAALTQAIIQPGTTLKTDGLGNCCVIGTAPVVVYAAPGTYTYTISGTGIAAPQGPYTIGVSIVPSNNVNFTGNVTATAGQVALGCKQIANVRCMDAANVAGWSGSDLAGWTSSLYSSCGASTSCTAFVQNGTYAIPSASIAVGDSTNLCPNYPGNQTQTFYADTGFQITLNNKFQVNCDGYLSAPSPFANWITAGGSLASGPVFEMGDNVHAINAGISNFRINANGTGLTAIRARGLNDSSWIKNNLIQNYTTNCILVDNSTAIGGIFPLVENNCAGASTASDGILLNSTQNLLLRNTVVSNSVSSISAAAFHTLNGFNTYIQNHTEKHTDGILVSGATGRTVILGHTGLNDTNTFHIDSTAVNQLQVAIGLIPNGDTTTIKNDLACFGGTANTTASEGIYVVQPTSLGSCPTLFTTDPSIISSQFGNPRVEIVNQSAANGAAFRTMTNGTGGNSVDFRVGSEQSAASVADVQTISNHPIKISTHNVLAATFDTSQNLSLSKLISSYNGITTAGQGVSVIPCITSQKTESGADTNVLTCTPLAQAGSYRIRFIMSLSAANAATLGWTATWTDSNGNAQTPTNLSLYQSGVAAPALTFTTSAAGNYYGDAQVDVNNAGTAIVIKLTFSGTSFTGKVSAIVERLI